MKSRHAEHNKIGQVMLSFFRRLLRLLSGRKAMGSKPRKNYRFGTHSRRQLATLHPSFQAVLHEVLETDDFAIDQGGRTEAQQWEYYNAGTSQLHPPDGKHLIQPDGWAYAADLCPWINGHRLATDAESFGPYQMAQFAWFLRRVEQVGEYLLRAQALVTGEHFHLRFGINWDGDAEILTDQKFQDWFHVEMVRVRAGEGGGHG